MMIGSGGASISLSNRLFNIRGVILESGGLPSRDELKEQDDGRKNAEDVLV